MSQLRFSRPNEQDLQTIHNIQEQLLPGKKLRDFTKRPEMLDNFIDDLQDIYGALENSKIGALPAAQALPMVDPFATSIETINTNINKAIAHLNNAVLSIEEVNRIRFDGNKAGKDAIDTSTYQGLFLDYLNQCRQSLIAAEQVVIQLLKKTSGNQKTG